MLHTARPTQEIDWLDLALIQLREKRHRNKPLSHTCLACKKVIAVIRADSEHAFATDKQHNDLARVRFMKFAKKH